MNAPLNSLLRPPEAQAALLADAVSQACSRIAPTWPLDQFIAVNPYWGWLQRPIGEAAAELGVLAGTGLTMPRAWFRSRWQAGALQHRHLQAVVQRQGGVPRLAQLLAALDEGEPHARLPAGTCAALQRPLLCADLCEAATPGSPLPWPDAVTHQISQHCAAHFDTSQARWQPQRQGGLYAGWKRHIAADRGIAWPAGRAAALQHIAALPDEPMAAIAHALARLGVPAAGWASYLSALLLAINGWAAWCAWQRWQARLAGADDDSPVQLLAVRLAWEALLQPAPAPAAWAGAWAKLQTQVEHLAHQQQVDWALQQAAELAWQQPLCAQLARQRPPAARTTPAVQAVFCIDVRSEVFRRALEAADAGIHTRGFAGFFGLPIAYSPAGSMLTRPQLPGLLAPAFTATEGAGAGHGSSGSNISHSSAASGPALGQLLAGQRRSALQWRQRWADLRGSAASAFSFVETCGLAYGAKLLADSLPSTRPAQRWEDTGLPASARGSAPALPQARSDVAATARMLQGILGAMGLPCRREGIAALVLLAGHGSHTTNNPHAAGLDCGACGGQTGEVNARVLAGLLNDPALRQALLGLGVAIPPGTHFVPGLHNTTTDELLLFDLAAVPAALAPALQQLQAALQQAGALARAERAPALELPVPMPGPADGSGAQALLQAVRQRANDWSHTRPEWGLADNAGFIVAPRWRTRGIDLGGRCFLHDYDHRQDPTLGVLELVMTAPMVVTNWINLQYHASAVDPRRYGSGNKLLHNVVGGRIGVFEGNGGDLRIGLPLQSLHDGHALRHTPLRLSVFIEAPVAALDTIIGRHAVVRDLVDKGWLHLFCIVPDDSPGNVADAPAGRPTQLLQRQGGRWQAVAPAW